MLEGDGQVAPSVPKVRAQSQEDSVAPGGEGAGGSTRRVRVLRPFASGPVLRWGGRRMLTDDDSPRAAP
jgi:hypothetical protein